jgi:hypothetical protein
MGYNAMYFACNQAKFRKKSRIYLKGRRVRQATNEYETNGEQIYSSTMSFGFQWTVLRYTSEHCPSHSFVLVSLIVVLCPTALAILAEQI